MTDLKSASVWKISNYLFPQLPEKAVAVLLFTRGGSSLEGYLTITDITEGEYSEKRSRFIGVLSPCDSEERASEIIAATKSKYFDARHTAFCYILKDGTARFSDDGEPHGTAGKPMLDVLEGSGIKDAIVTVTRYFGGVLLGTGGLVRAYSAAAKEAISKANVLEMCACTVLSVSCDYTYHSRLLSLIENSCAEVVDTEFTDKVKVIFRMRSGDTDTFRANLCENFASKLAATTEKEEFFPFKIKK